MNDVPLRDHITPHHVYLDLLKFRDIVKMYTCLFLWDQLCGDKPCHFSISLLSEQHNYFTRSASTQQLSLAPPLLANTIGMTSLFQFALIHLKSSLKRHFTNIILLNINLLDSSHGVCVCVCVH